MRRRQQMSPPEIPTAKKRRSVVRPPDVTDTTVPKRRSGNGPPGDSPSEQDGRVRMKKNAAKTDRKKPVRETISATPQKHLSHEHDDRPTTGARTHASRAEVSLPNTFRTATKKRTEKLPSGTSADKARMGETPISLPDASIKIIGAEYRPPSGRPRWPPSR